MPVAASPGRAEDSSVTRAGRIKTATAPPAFLRSPRASIAATPRKLGYEILAHQTSAGRHHA